MKNEETIKSLNRAKTIAWIVFAGIGVNYILLTLFLQA